MHTDSTYDWWDAMLAGHAADGRRDADRGVFEPPYPCCAAADPQDEDENEAYERAWHQRRKELGDAFKWA